MDRERMASAVAAFLDAVGADRTHPHLVDTPERVAEAWSDEILWGYGADVAALLTGFPAAGQRERTVITTGIRYVSVCPHHLLPYPGVAHVAYVPGAREVGFGELVRAVDALGARLVLQEDHAQAVVDALTTHLGARGAGVILDAHQMCMTVRGVRRPDARVRCSAWAGVFAEADAAPRRELLDAVSAWQQEGRHAGG